jgi:hypothetical protein
MFKSVIASKKIGRIYVTVLICLLNLRLFGEGREIPKEI